MKKIALKDKNLYYIGGVVRDEILGLESFDIDLTYQGDAINFSKQLEYECIQVNEPFGTVRMLIDGEEVDIASTRDEVYDKKGHLPTVFDIGCDLKKDVLRRDFTINSLAKSTLTNEIVDYTSGVNDIKNKTLRVLHDGSFIDDPTRIVRGLKFAVRFGFELDEHTKDLQEKYLKNINYDMSFKRLKKELIETFNLNKQTAFDRFITQNIYKLLGDTKLYDFREDIEALINRYPVRNVWIVYTGWHDGIDNLPLTKEEQKIINDFRGLIDAFIEEDNYSIYKAFEGKSPESVLLYTVVTKSDLGLKYFDIQNIKTVITGDDLRGMGYPPSKRYSECFDYVLKHKLENPSITGQEELELANEFMGLFPNSPLETER